MTEHPSPSAPAPGRRRPKQPWEPPRLRYEGNTGELIQGGGGKSGIASDPGEPLKPQGAG
jgi:hypothetical protein